jgi:hypothetical protein
MQAELTSRDLISITLRMFRPSRRLSLLLVASLALTGCKTVYSDMYSPRRNRFVPPPKPVEKSDVLPPPTTGTPNIVTPGPDAFTAPAPTTGVPGMQADPGSGAMVAPVPGL